MVSLDVGPAQDGTTQGDTAPTAVPQNGTAPTAVPQNGTTPTSAAPARQIEPSLVLRPGAFDPIALLVLRCLRRIVYPLLFVGFTIAWVNGDFTAEAFARLTTPTQYLDALLSPLVVVAFALGLRVVVAALGFVVAIPLTADAWKPGTDARTLMRRMWDRYYLTSSYATLRWTWAVHQFAVARGGAAGTLLDVVERVIRVALPVSIGVFVVVALRTL
ncbi:hypothetical protein CLV28_2221 [Sediminihabitans luteus]|uniref:Uncharacterized protein n=1 Tax=Sediminihabitans luteus TaxID=1138585 RepID=A0A2M9CEL3_9CELL|nr:hypothetical protein [Sediminihabitans luteus]PJJ70386.1 hypothetical protein CLV28_2221 [Sediminihabitans luteus]GII97858.1 hypothetical protein Slu03_02360 [Sediminihabitans luteus]